MSFWEMMHSVWKSGLVQSFALEGWTETETSPQKSGNCQKLDQTTKDQSKGVSLSLFAVTRLVLTGYSWDQFWTSLDWSCSSTICYFILWHFILRYTVTTLGQYIPEHPMLQSMWPDRWHQEKPHLKILYNSALLCRILHQNVKTDMIMQMFQIF